MLVRQQVDRRSKQHIFALRPFSLTDITYSRDVFTCSTAPDKPVWDQLNVPLAKRELDLDASASGTKTEIPSIFPSVPCKTHSLDFTQLEHLCAADIAEMKERQTNQVLAFESQYYDDGTPIGIVSDEIGLSACVFAETCTILLHAKRAGALQPLPVIRTGGKETIGNMVAQIGREWTTVSGRGKIRQMMMKHVDIDVGVKTPECDGSDLAKNWCSFPCYNHARDENGKLVKDKTGRTTIIECNSERHKAVSHVRQVYNYQAINGLLFALFTNHKQYVGFIRDCHGNLVITHACSWDSTMDPKIPGSMSVAQFLVLFCRMAARKEVPSGLIELGLLVKCKDGCDHKVLPKECDVDWQNAEYKGRINQSPLSKPASVSIASSARAAGGIRHTRRLSGYFGGDSRAGSTSVHNLPGGEYLGSFRTGLARRTCIDGKAAVIKILDIAKMPEREVEIQHEACVYHQLDDLWGKEVPSLLGCGRLQENFLCALATTDEGNSLDDLDGSANDDDRISNPDADSFLAAAKAALRKIHDRGVLHGDIRRGNILKRHSDGAPVFIDFGMAKVMHGPVSEEARMQEMNELEMVLSEPSNYY
jgi:serine/threonine protein kinase